MDKLTIMVENIEEKFHCKQWKKNSLNTQAIDQLIKMNGIFFLFLIHKDNTVKMWWLKNTWQMAKKYMTDG